MIKSKQLENTLRSESNPFDIVYADRTVGDLNGAVRFTALNNTGSTIGAYKVVYINGVSGNTPTIALADADTASMPAFGLTSSSSDNGDEVDVITFGNVKGVDTSLLTVGDVLYVSTTAGEYTTTPPTGSSAKLQNIGMVVKANSNGIIKVGGAGRSAATPNLDQGKIFIGNASNQSSSSAYTLPITDGNAGDVLTTDGAGAVTFSAPSAGATTPTLISANTSLSTDTHYVIDPSITGGLTLSVPNSNVTDGAQIHVTNLSTQPITIELYDTSGQAKLYYADGTLAPSPAIYRDRITVESQGTIRLYQAGAGDPVEWYLYHSPAFEVEAPTDELATAQTLAYSTQRKAFVSAGEIHGEKILSANVSSTVYPYHLYATAYDETTARTVSLPDRYNNEDLVSELNGQRVYFENRGASTLTINLFDNYIYTSGVYYRAYLRRFDNTQISGNTYTLHPGERVEIEVETEDLSASDFRVYYRLGKYSPIYETTEDTSGANATISHGQEKHLTYIVNTANNVTVTLPTLTDCKPNYQVTVKNSGAGTVTLNRGSTDTFDNATSTTLAQYDTITLSKRSSSTWSIVNPITPTTSDDLTGNITPTNYTATTSDTLSTHLSAIDSALGSSGGGSTPSVTSANPSTTYGITDTSTAHQVYLLTPTADVDVTLPSAATAGSGSRYDVKNLASGFALTLKGQTGDNIDGVAPTTGIIIGTQYESLTVISDGSDWFII